MGTTPKPLGKAMYVASELDQSWLQSMQRKLYTQSWQEPDYLFRKLWGLVTDRHNLRTAFARVARNKGRRTSGVDGITVGKLVAQGVDGFVEQLRSELRSGAFRPSPVRRVLIPKSGKPTETRPLGIPTVKDRVVQAALKSILEPIFEADFYPSSYGFRPATGVWPALEEARKLLLPKNVRRGEETEIRFPYQWAIEGDIKGCFDHISHHGLMKRMRRRIADPKVNRLVVTFLKSGVLSEEHFLRTNAGTPQGGILSPLLANIALSRIDERYERSVWPRRQVGTRASSKQIRQYAAWNRGNDKRRGRIVFVPIRYADDFIIFVGAPIGPDQQERAETAAHEERAALAKVLKEELNLELSESKTLVTQVTQPMRFLGHHVRVQHHPRMGWCSKTVIPKDQSQRLRELIKDHFSRSTHNDSLEGRLRRLNRMLHGWGNFHRHAWGAKNVFTCLDHYVWWTISRWLRKKHQGLGMRRICARYGWRKPGGRRIRWCDGSAIVFELASLRVERYRHAWLNPPAFAVTIHGEPSA